MFAFTSRFCINNLCISLLKTQKGNHSAAAYFNHMRSLVDELVIAGDPITNYQLLAFNIAGLDMDYQHIISALDVSTEPPSINDLFSMVRNFEQRLNFFTGWAWRLQVFGKQCQERRQWCLPKPVQQRPPWPRRHWLPWPQQWLRWRRL